MTDTRHERATTMSTVDHTHPDTGRPFGDAVVYQRGPAVAADGGERTNGSRTSADVPSAESERERSGREEAADAESDASADTDESVDGERMKDVDHEPPTQAEPNRVFERGTEGRDDAR
ncbi:hypothetical protein ACTG0T_12875 [Halococcus morrhuae DSM 1307]|uniref:hypothetical protein n=1 Tax=Halococcus morrhuae TaxID=2250 RepID=UPI003F83B73C